MSTIKDVAKHANVGAATVSRVLSGKGYVKAETRDRITDAIHELNYTPNEMARNLFYRKTGIVAVSIPRLSHPFFTEFVSEVEAELGKEGYQTMVCSTWSEQNHEQRYLDMLERQIVDGIIFGSHTLDVEQYRKVGRPIVALDRDLGPEIPCVAVDHEEGGRLAAEILLQAGCRKVLQFRGKGETFSPSEQRHDVFEKVIQKHGAVCYNYITKWNSLSYSYYAEITEHILEEYPDIDGVFAVDAIAMNVLRRAEEQNIRVPQDLKVVAYDGTNITQFASCGVTTICQPISQLASESVRLLMEMIRGEIPREKNVKLNVTVRKGRSTMIE